MRVALTRPRPDSEALAPRLVALGYVPVIAPVMRIATLPVALPTGAIDGVVITSRHAVAALSAAQADQLRHAPAFAVGAATAAAARSAGLADVRVGTEDAAALLALVRLTLRPRSRLLYLAGVEHKPDLPRALESDGHDLVVARVYDAQPVAWDGATCADLAARPPEAWLHLSRRSAALAIAAAEGGGLGPAFASGLHLGLSADAALPLRDRASLRVAVANRPTIDSLLQALVTTLGRHDG